MSSEGRGSCGSKALINQRDVMSRDDITNSVKVRVHEYRRNSELSKTLTSDQPST